MSAGNNGFYGFSAKQNIVVPESKILHVSASDQPYNNGDAVDTLYDSSGYNHHLTAQVTAKATFVTNAMNGQPVFRFANNARYRIAKQLFTLPSYSIFAVLKAPLQTLGWGVIIGQFDGSANGRMLLYALSTSSNLCRMYHYTTATYTVQSISPVYNSTPNLVISELYDNTITMEVNNGGVESTLAITNQLYANYGVSIGGIPPSPYNFLSGDLAEIIAFQPVLSEQQKAEVKEYLNAKYALWA